MTDATEGALARVRATIDAGAIGLAADLRSILAHIDAQAAEIERLRVDAERIDWIEEHARKRKIEIAVSMLKTGFEFGFWPACRAIARTGTLRECIDAAMKDQK